ncbi:hypothetical protein C4577_04955 [Candidatus Parcubacteria bacterium]|nr:MAG: hypothetical protein C4577_04955 [Candidatus Parcubacteria bacterium]
MKYIPRDEWLDICLQLEDFHSVFYKLWEMGKPVFTEEIDTAAVTFDKGGDFVQFLFNPKFWDKCNAYERLFVICHEALHVIFNHGIRTKTALDKQACNVALDIVVNHTLVRSFKFDRTKIKGWKKLCWVDTVFKGPKGKPRLDKVGRPIPDNECFEYYISLFDRLEIDVATVCAGSGSKGMGGLGLPGEGDGEGVAPLDDHSKMGDFADIIGKLDKGLSDEEKAGIENTVKRHFQKEEGGMPGGKLAGKGAGNLWHFAAKKDIRKKKKWETVIKKWSQKFIKRHDKDHEQWARLNRRFQFLPSKLFLPSDMEIDTREKEKNRIKVFFFLDTSGSCYHLKDRFFQAAETLPKERFDIRLFCFDDAVFETTLASRKMKGGGGTSFALIERHIQQDKKKENTEYPKAVFIITDGYGDEVKPEIPKNWYWFLSTVPVNVHSSEKSTAWVESHYISQLAPKECNFYNLNDYE